MKNIKREKILFVTSDLYYVKGFLVGQIKEAAKKFEVYLVVNATYSEVTSLFGDSVKFKNCGIERKISIFKDGISLLQMCILIFFLKPNIVHSTTPKAGLIAMLSSFINRVPFRMHTFTGQVWQTKKGVYKSLLKIIDKLTATTATHILCDSHSQRFFLIDNNVIDKKKSHVILNGSIRGIDSEKFSPSDVNRSKIRQELKITDVDVLILYMARFTIDKGAILMAQAFEKLVIRNPNVFLLMVGPDEENLADDINNLLNKYKYRYKILNYTDSPEKYFSACDIFCLPSYREGFPMVLLNAASSAVPVVASRIYGTSDIVLDQKTGFLFNPGDLDDLVEKLFNLSGNRNTINIFGKNARNYAVQNFSEKNITEALMNIYLHRKFPAP